MAMTHACLLLVAGMLAPQLTSFPFLSDHYVLLLVSGIALAAVRVLRPIGLLMLGAGLFGQSVAAVVESRLEPALVGDSLLVTVRVADFAGRRDATTTFVAEVAGSPRLPRRVRISWFDAPVTVRPGDTWRLELRLKRPRASSNPGGFDYEAWLTRERVGATGYVVAGPRNHLVASDGGGFLLRFRARFVERLGSAVPDSDSAAVLAALVVGARHLLTPEQWDRFARSGTTHLMAISGLHIGLAAAGGYWLGRLLALLLPASGNAHRVAVCAAVTVAALYAAVSGLALPSQRASMMLLLGGIAVLRRRRADAVRIVAVVAALVAGSDPLVTMSPGFRLSFGAVIILLWYARSQAGRRGFAARIRQLASVQVLLLMGLLPIVGPVFGLLAAGAPLANLVAVPVFSAITVPAALLGLALQGPLEIGGNACLRVAAASIDLLEPLIASIANFESLTVGLPELAGAGLVLALLPVIVVVLPAGWPGRGIAWLGLASLIAYSPPPPGAGCALLTVLDVGQGLATVVTTRRHVLLYDTGPQYFGGGDSAESVLLPYLQSRGIRGVDRLIVSHSDLDHAGGIRTLLDGVSVGETLTSEAIEAAGPGAQRCVAGTSWTWDGVHFEILHPDRNSRADGNDRSCVLRIAAGERTALLPGDIERSAETALVASDRLQPADVVVMPHHGSTTSSSEAFVSAVNPRIAIAPTGFGNRWGFPHAAVVARWQAAGAVVLTTADSGAISIDLCASFTEPQLREARMERRRIWHE